MGRIWGTVKCLLICYNECFVEETFRERLGEFCWESMLLNTRVKILRLLY